MRFALHGPMFSGKSTLARLLRDYYGYTWLNYTDYGKLLCAQALTALLGREVTQAEVIERKNEWRDFIIQALRIYGFDQGAGVEDLVASCFGQPNIVFDNVRYESQWEKLKKHGFTLVRLYVTDEQQRERAARAGMPLAKLLTLREESSEAPLMPEPDEIRLPAIAEPPVLLNLLLGHAASESSATR